MRPIKNKKRRDPRYFLHEQNEDDPAQEMRDRIAAHQGVESTPARSGQEIANELGYGEEPSEETPSEAGGVPPEIALMETLWDLVGDFYRAGRSDVAFKLQKIAEMADPSHKRLVSREFGGERHEPSLDDEPGGLDLDMPGDPGFMLGPPKEDSMGRHGSRGGVNSLRGKAMRK